MISPSGTTKHAGVSPVPIWFFVCLFVFYVKEFIIKKWLTSVFQVLIFNGSSNYQSFVLIGRERKHNPKQDSENPVTILGIQD